MWKNQKAQMYHKSVVAPQTVTADTNSASVDTQDINSLGFLISLGTFSFSGTNKIDVKLQHSDDNSAWSDVVDVYSGTAPIVLTLDTASEDEMSHLVEYRGGKRYARLQLDVSGTVSVTAAVIAVSIHPELQPPAL